MFNVWSSLTELRQPCLYRPLSDALLDRSGLVRKEVLTSIDRLLCEHLAWSQAPFQTPPSPPPMASDHRFLNVSALQKSIRRGDAGGAMRFAQQGCSIDAEHVFRRLAVCAVEDVGIGNLLAVGMALAIMGNRSMRQDGAAGELAAYLAYLLAISPKSRLACDLLSIADYDRTLNPIKAAFDKLSPDELAAVIENRTIPLAHRIIAAWLLAGSARFTGSTIPKVSRPKSEFLKLIARARLPLAFYYIADRTAGRLGEAMFISMLFIWEMLSAEPQLLTRQHILAEGELISGFPAASFDMHTREGRLALSRFARECQPVARLLGRLGSAQRDTAARHALFIVEGGQLKEQVRCAATDEIEAEAHRMELAYSGLSDTVQQSRLLRAVWDNLAFLNRLRRAIASA